ncbi:hypothetical protein HYS48_04475 [Candidatus Woesearchaeota archaeon]|nr:hypothetical protein [Candidatus Woesearchaeota archaeon]
MDLKNNFRSIELNKEICEFIGAFIGDGYLTRYRNIYTMGISGNRNLDENYLKKYMQSLIKRNFPFTTPRLYYRKDENTLVLKVYSKQLYYFLKKIGFNAGKKAHSIMIPQEIVNNKEFMRAAIKGIFDTDGCIFFDQRKTYHRPYPRITLQMASIPLIMQLETFLSKDFTLYVDKSNRDGKRNTIEIYGHKQLETFLKQIGLSNKRHLDKITKNAPVA